MCLVHCSRKIVLHNIAYTTDTKILYVHIESAEANAHHINFNFTTDICLLCQHTLS